MGVGVFVGSGFVLYAKESYLLKKNIIINKILIGGVLLFLFSGKVYISSPSFYAADNM